MNINRSVFRKKVNIISKKSNSWSKLRNDSVNLKINIYLSKTIYMFIFPCGLTRKGTNYKYH